MEKRWQMQTRKFLRTMREFKKTAYHDYGNRPWSVVKFIYYSAFKRNSFVVVGFPLDKAIPDCPLDSDFTVIKPTLEELRKLRAGKELPREFYYDEFHGVRRCYVALCAGDLAYIHWVYVKGDYNRFLRLSEGVAELNYNTCLPKHRGRGLMAKMIVYIFRDLQKDGFRMAVGVAHAENPPALKSTFKAGFREIGRIRTLGPFSRKFRI